MSCALSDDGLRRMLRDDVPFGDLTTRSLGIGGASAKMVMSARTAMRVCGSEEAARLIELSGARVTSHVASGSDAEKGAELVCATGRVAALHLAWKTAQTLIESLSGIASSAAQIRAALAAEGFDIPLACTRKNFPGTRALAAKAVHAGGAVAHRLGLSETLLVFPEHRVFVDKNSLAKAFAEVKRGHPEKKLVAEAADLADALWLAECGAEVLQLERFSPEALRECRQALLARQLKVLLTPAGGVNVENAVAYARAGADFLVTSAPYFAPPRDVKVEFIPVS